ncbi:MAG: class I SAM-dependent DNA methyltransferase [Candidatus Hodarchaeota archaeon]
MSNLKAIGQYFTPRFVAEFMVSLIQKDKSVRVIEPSAGRGIFLDVLWKKGFRNLQAYEIDQNLPNESPVEITYRDFLTTDNLPSPEVIIGNPPYVRWKNLPKKDRERFKKDPQWKGIVNGLSDLSYAFIHRCVDLLQPGGELIFITPYFWTETLHSSKLRHKIAKSGELSVFINFHELRVFSAVSLSTIIFKFVKSRSNRQIKILHIWSKANLTKDIILRLGNCLKRLEQGENYISEGEIEAYTHQQVKGGIPWKFLSPTIRGQLKAIEEACTSNAPQVRVASGDQVSLTRLYEKEDLERFNLSEKTLTRSKFRARAYWFSKASAKTLDSFMLKKNEGADNKAFSLPVRCVRLGDIADIGNGMVSGLDKAFRLPKDFELSPKEKEIVIPVVKAKSLHQFYYEGVTPYAFPNGISSEKELQKDYPTIYKLIQRFKAPLMKRYNYNRQIPWWEWVFLRNKALFEENSNKIFVPCKDRFDSRGYVRFALVQGNSYATQDVTAIVKSALFKEDEKYLVAVLNSEITFQWLRHKGLTRGGVLEFSEKPLTRIPIRLINWNDNEEVKSHNSIVKLVDQIIRTQQVEPHKSQIEDALRNLYYGTKGHGTS